MKPLARLVAAAAAFVSLPALAESPFSSIPDSGLQMRMVRYDGHTNGQIEVEVRNPTDRALEFVARGLYFVPNGSADSAPQRVGAVGPFQAQLDKGWEQLDHLSVAPHATVRLKIDVYCIDSHRASPSPATGFHVARDRVPKPMADAIAKDASDASAPQGGIAAPAAKSAVQGQVWKNRDKKWIPLEGEGTQEAGKRR
jgi:hypothetical protein